PSRTINDSFQTPTSMLPFKKKTMPPNIFFSSMFLRRARASRMRSARIASNAIENPDLEKASPFRTEYSIRVRVNAMTPTLCELCQNMREVRTSRSCFLLCELSATNATYPKYPPQPVIQCDGYKPMEQATGQEKTEPGS